MVSGRAVVVGYDGSPASAAAARWAATEAALRDLPLRVVHVPAWPVLRAPTAAAVMTRLEHVRRAAERLLDQECQAIRADHPGLRIDVAVVVGDTVPVLLREATDAAVLVLGSRGLGEFRDLAAGSVMTHLATHATCPVVVVPAGRHAEPSVEPEIGVDGSEHSATIGG